MEIGSVSQAVTLVTKGATAITVRSGSLPVYATPAMAALMEEAACTCAAPFLKGDETTVGISLSIRHTAASPVGMKVYAEARLTAADGKRLTFDLRAWDDVGEIGSGTHERVIVSSEAFLANVQQKRGRQG